MKTEHGFEKERRSVRLDLYWARMDRGRSLVIEAAWNVVQEFLFATGLPGTRWRTAVLRLFGARIGRGVVIKPRARIKFPWRLQVGDFSWLGEALWIDNLAEVAIGNHCCISQGAYLCTGNHDWSSERFDLITRPISIHNGAWIGAYAVVGPGVIVGEGAVLSLGGVANHDLAPWFVYSGNPAAPIGPRELKSAGEAGHASR